MQLMVYKCLWDNIVTSGVPFDYFFEHFRLRPQHLLSEDIRVHAAEIFPDAQVFITFLVFFRFVCFFPLPVAPVNTSSFFHSDTVNRFAVLKPQTQISCY